jgi:hypothetical protein
MVGLVSATVPSFVAELFSVMDFLSSDVSQKSEGNQGARKSVICSHTCESRGSALVAYQRPKLDGRLEGLHIYTGHLSKFKSRFNG